MYSLIEMGLELDIRRRFQSPFLGLSILGAAPCLDSGK